jgi:hypothetical protein
VDFSQVRIKLVGGTYNSQSNPGTAEFDNFEATLWCP